MAKNHPTVIAIGQNKGHPVTKFKTAQHKGKPVVKQASKKGLIGKRVRLIRQVISEVSGVSTY
jgi:hypothetical protein